MNPGAGRRLVALSVALALTFAAILTSCVDLAAVDGPPATRTSADRNSELALHGFGLTDGAHKVPRPTIRLRWIQNYTSEKKSFVPTGLFWTLSLLGAELPADRKDEIIYWVGKDQLVVDLHAAGFSLPALKALDKLCDQLRDTGEYEANGAIDVGRFVMLTLNSSWHYYAITGVSPTVTTFRERYPFKGKQAWLVNSGIATGHRLVEIADGPKFRDTAWIASEGYGSLPGGSFKAAEFEAIDTMPNGQLRFALYDQHGLLKAAADPKLTTAGKPAKCAWCHEGDLQPSFANDAFVHHVMPEAHFDKLINHHNDLIAKHKKRLDPVIDHTDKKAHSYLEKLYIGFAEPSAERLADEWALPLAKIKALVKGIPTHKEQFYHVWFGPLYHRRDIEDLAPYASVRTPSDALERSFYEPNLLTTN